MTAISRPERTKAQVILNTAITAAGCTILAAGIGTNAATQKEMHKQVVEHKRSESDAKTNNILMGVGVGIITIPGGVITIAGIRGLIRKPEDDEYFNINTSS